MKTDVMFEVERHFRPEFLNRVDEVVLFKPLVLEEIVRIVKLQTLALVKRLAERDVGLELTEAAERHIAEVGFDPVYGARPLKRYIQRELETKIGRRLLAGQVGSGQILRVDADAKGLTLEVVTPAVH
jgi:ATP-dependent Clp protease ATP-binding subunit ClpB